MADESIDDEPIYDEWVVNRRAVQPSGELTDRVMATVEERYKLNHSYLCLADRMNESPPARWAACVAALLVGSLPLLFAAHVAKLLVF